MELRHLHSLEMVAQVGGFHRAAEQLGYSQSSITAHIKDLEEELGVPLFDRLGKKVCLTWAGEQFMPYAQNIIRLYSESKERLDSSEKPHGELKIGAAESLLNYWLPASLKHLNDNYPNMTLRLKPVDVSNIERQLAGNELDIALIIEEVQWKPSSLFTYQCIPQQAAFVCRNKTKGKNKELTMLYTEEGCSWRTLFDKVVREKNLSNIVKMELASVVAIKQCVLSGMGNSLLPRFVVEEELKNKQLEEINVSLPEEPLAIYIVMHKNKWVSPTMRAFLDGIQLR